MFRQNRRSIKRRDYRCVIAAAIVFCYCYVLRLLLIVHDPDLVAWTMPDLAFDGMTDARTLQAAFVLVAWFGFGFFWFCFIQAALPRRTVRIKQQGESQPKPTYRRIAVLLFGATFLLSSLTSWTLFNLGIGIQGQFSQTILPFKLAGILIYLKNAALPAVLIACIYLLERSGHPFSSRVCAILLIGLGIVDMFSFDTRSGALRAVVLLALLWWIAGIRLRRLDKMLIGLCTIMLPTLIATVTQKRLFGEVINTSTYDQFKDGFEFLLFRITGAEHLAAIIHLSAPLNLMEAWSAILSDRGLSGYYTTELLQFNPDIPQTFAPSGIGWLYLAGGHGLVLAGGLFLGYASTGIYSFITRILPILSPVAKSLYIFSVVSILSEGTIGTPLTSLAIGCTTLLIIEKFALSSRSNSSRNVHHKEPDDCSTYRLV